MESENGIVDEIMTPCCPQCAVKHLSAAIAHMSSRRGPIVFPDVSDVLCARAAINADEAAVGYRSHRWLAIGIMVTAEEHSLGKGDVGKALLVRRARLRYLADGLPRDIRRVYEETDGSAYGNLVEAIGHWCEANREAPDDVEVPMMHMWENPTAEAFVERAVGALEKLHEDYFKVGQAEESGVHKAD